MQLEYIIYPIYTLGPGKRVGIWTIGCSHNCPNCTSHELHQENIDKDIPLSKIYKSLKAVPDKIDGVTITGGEPFDQIDELIELVKFISQSITKDILIYSGYTFSELHELYCNKIFKVLDNISILIDGPYIEEQNDNKTPLVGSLNQTIFLVKKEYKKKYVEYISKPRFFQNLQLNDIILSVGLPFQNDKINISKSLIEKGVYNESTTPPKMA